MALLSLHLVPGLGTRIPRQDRSETITVSTAGYASFNAVKAAARKHKYSLKPNLLVYAPPAAARKHKHSLKPNLLVGGNGTDGPSCSCRKLRRAFSALFRDLQSL